MASAKLIKKFLYVHLDASLVFGNIAGEVAGEACVEVGPVKFSFSGPELFFSFWKKKDGAHQ